MPACTQNLIYNEKNGLFAKRNFEKYKRKLMEKKKDCYNFIFTTTTTSNNKNYIF